jgi:DNA polymerase-3 subunit chi
VTAVSFYHLERQGPDVALPRLLAKARERGWRALVKVAGAERLAALDVALWTFADDTFLPHGRAGDPHEEDQPILLTEADANPNGAAVLFVVDGADLPAEIGGFERVAILLDGSDEAALQEGRRVFKALRQAGHAIDYWKQNEGGAWFKAA